jgi:hypothetical protein
MPVPAAVIERLLGRREVPDQTKAHRVDRSYRRMTESEQLEDKDGGHHVLERLAARFTRTTLVINTGGASSRSSIPARSSRPIIAGP